MPRRTAPLRQRSCARLSAACVLDAPPFSAEPSALSSRRAALTPDAERRLAGRGAGEADGGGRAALIVPHLCEVQSRLLVRTASFCTERSGHCAARPVSTPRPLVDLLPPALFSPKGPCPPPLRSAEGR